MKYVKTLAVAAIAAVALTATSGATKASATTLCENNQTTDCTSHVANGSTLKFSAEDSIKLTGPFGFVIDTCTESTVEGTTSTTGGSAGGAVTGAVKTLTFGKCIRPTTVGAGGTLLVQNVAGTDNGTVTSSGATVTVHELPNNFGNPSTCAYTTSNTDIGTLTGSTTAPTFDIAATITSETANCPSGTWSGHYVYTGSTPFIAGSTVAKTTLCENNQTTGCTSHVASGSTLNFSAETSIKLAGPFGIVLDTCNESAVEGPTTATGSSAGAVTGEVNTLTFGNCTRSTTVAPAPPSHTLEISSISGTDNGAVRSSGATVTIHELPNIIGNPPTCSYVTNNTPLGTLTGSLTAPTFDISATIPSETEGCPSGTWSGHYVYTGTTPFIVSES